MGSCNSSEVKEVSKSQPKLNPKAEFFSSKGEKLSDLKGYHDTPSQKIEIIIMLKNVDKAFYSIELSQRIDNNNIALGSTQPIEGTVIDFMTSFKLNYYFEKEQTIFLKVKKDSYVSNYDFSVGRLMGAKGQKIILPFEGNGSIDIQGQNSQEECFEAKISVSVNNKSNKKLDTYFTIERDITKLNNIQFIKSYRSELFYERTPGTIKFNEFILSTNSLNDNNNSKPFRLQFYNLNNNELIGYQQIRVDSFNQTNGFRNKYFLLDKTGNQNNSYEIEITLILKKVYTFVEYLRGGLQISMILGIDFTASNKTIQDPNSLHYIQSNQPNLYEKAILSCGNIVAFYDYDKMFPVFGYGAILPGHGDNVSHCFPVNFTQNPNIYTVENIALAYRECAKTVRFFGPTYFTPIIRETINTCRCQGNRDVYYILMILTDGKINDIEETIDAIVEASFLPISIIIIGIGDSPDFNEMERLDADINPLVSSNGTKATRDLVQFVEFSKHQNNGIKLAEEVLMEIPSQVEYYYKINNREANQPVNI